MTVAHLQELLMVITIFHWVGEQPVAHLLAIAVTLATLCLAMTESPVSMVTGMMQRPDVGKWVRTFSYFKQERFPVGCIPPSFLVRGRW